jgi:processive 1,2-diacylglycerol beta-glucosyltransferase
MRVLIISASAGGGHVRAGQALEEAARLADPEADVRHVDILDFTAKVYKKTYAGGYLKMVDRAPALWGALYQASDRIKRRRVQDRFVGFFDKLEFAGFRSFVREFGPQVIFATHFLPCQVFAPYRQKDRDRPRKCVLTFPPLPHI